MPLALKICAPSRLWDAPKCIPMPGGVQLCAAAVPSSLDGLQGLFGKVNSALAPLVPIFTIIEVLISLKNCITAIPDCLMPPSPSPILKCIKDLIRNLDQLLKMIPQLSVPLLVLGIVDALIAFISSYRSAILLLVARQQQLVTAETRAAQLNDARLLVTLGCAKTNLGIEFQNLNAGVGPVNQLVAIINALLDIVGLPCLPGLTVPTDLTADAVLPLTDAINILTKLRGLIPVPSSGPGNSFGKICQ